MTTNKLAGSSASPSIKIRPARNTNGVLCFHGPVFEQLQLGLRVEAANQLAPQGLGSGVNLTATASPLQEVLPSV